MTQNPQSTPTPSTVQHLNPDDLHKNRAFTQVIQVTGPARTIYVSGQDAVDAQGTLVGKDDIQAQAHQVLTNLRIALAAAGAKPEHLIKWNVYLVQGQSLQAGFAAFQQFWGNRPNPPAITMLYVSELAHPDFLIEMDAIAIVPFSEMADVSST